MSPALSVLATAVLGLSLGWLVSRRGVRVVRAAADTGDRFLSGHLDERLKVSPRDDEFDRLAEVFNACLDEIERMVRSLRAATDGLAHDLKTPLTRIKARLELAALRGPEAPTQDILADTARDLDALLSLVNGLLVLARADATTADSFVALDLAAVAQEAYDLYAPLAEDAGQHLVLQVSPAPARGVSSLLLHATANLIDNAIKHGSLDGQIVVATGLDGAVSRLTVGDRGPGIAPEARERAVQRFSRVDESRSTPGSGLGLSLVATVARVHRGQLVLADNRPGLKAELRLPLSPDWDLRPARAAKEFTGETGRGSGTEA
jgi:signal transduction histidine kinase